MEGLNMHDGHGCTIKVLDLLTNRYHVGVARHAGRDVLAVEMPASARMEPGQRVRFVLADDAAGVVSRRAMRLGVVSRVEHAGRTLFAELALGVEALAA